MKKLLVFCAVAAYAVMSLGDTALRTWNPTVQEGGFYKWGTAENWTPTGVPVNGDSVIFDSADAAISAYNDIDGVQLLNVTLRGTHDITLAGDKLVLCDQGGIYAENAPITVNVNLPIDLAGTVVFSSTSNGVSKGATFELNGAIGNFDTYTGSFKTGGDYSGIYNFRGNNTYSGRTELVEGLAYHVYSDTAFGTNDEKVYYHVPNDSLFGSNFDKYFSSIYLHGVTLDKSFEMAGRQLRDLVSMANTKNVIKGSIEPYAQSVERWEVQTGSQLYILGAVSFKDVCQLNVSTTDGTALVFSNTVTSASLIRAAASGAGRVVFADRVYGKSGIQVYQNGQIVMCAPNDCGGGNASAWSYNAAGSFVLENGPHTAKTFNDTVSGVVTSSDGSTLRVLEGGTAKTSFRGSVNLLVTGGTETLSGLSTTTGSLTADNGGKIVFSGSGHWANGSAVTVGANSQIDVVKSGTFAATAAVTLDATGKLNLASGVEEHVATLTIADAAQTRGKSYGGTGSGADVIDDIHFAGTGKLIVDGPLTLTWTGNGGDGKFSTAANWSPAQVPSKIDKLIIAVNDGATFNNDLTTLTELTGLTITGSGAATLTGNALGFANGAAVAATTAATLTFDLPVAFNGTAACTISAVAGATNVFSGVISGAAPITVSGAGTVKFTGANTFTGDLALNGEYFFATGTSPFGTADGKTTVTRPSTTAKFHCKDVTTSDAITYNGVNSQSGWILEGSNIFNGAISKGTEQIRVKIMYQSYTTFNADFATGIEYFTPETSGAGVLDFNCSWTGYFRPNGVSTYIFRKPVTYTSQDNSSYRFLHGLQSSGRMEYRCENAFGTASNKVVALTASGNSGAVIDFCGNDQIVAAVVGGSETITSSEGPATLHVLNSYKPVDSNKNLFNNGVFGGKFTGELSVSVEGNSNLEALTLSGVSTSTGTLVAKDGGRVVFQPTGRWAGDVEVQAGGTIEIPNSAVLTGEGIKVAVATDGTLKLDGGELQVAELWLSGAKCAFDKTYGPLGSGADYENACLTGTGKIVAHATDTPVVATTRTWQGPEGGTWSTPANWSPEGAPAANDVLVFNSAASAVSSVNDIAGLELMGLTFAGDHAIALSGNVVTLVQGAAIQATQSSAEITLGLTLNAVNGAKVGVVATAGGAGGVKWQFTGGFAGAGSFHFGGDHSAEVNLRGASADFDGNLFLTNAAAYHVWDGAALGTVNGYTLYALQVGNDAVNIERSVEPLYFHGVTTAEPFLWAGVASYGVHFADGTTNIFNGPIDMAAGYLPNGVGVDVERWWVGTNAYVELNGPVGLMTQPNGGDFNHIIPYQKTGSTFVVNGEMAAGGLRANGERESEYRVNHAFGHLGGAPYFGNFSYGTVVFGVTNALTHVASNRTRDFNFGSTGMAFYDLNGYDQDVFSFVYANQYTNAMRSAYFTDRRTNAVWHVKVPYNVVFTSHFGGGMGLALETPHLFTLAVTNNATGLLTITNGARVNFESQGRWLGDVAVAADSVLTLDNAARLTQGAKLSIAADGLVNIAAGMSQVISGLVLNGVEQEPGRSYGSPDSAAEVKSSLFAGTGVVFVSGEIVEGVVRTWKGGTGNWNVAGNWTPEGVPGDGDTLVFDAAAADVAANNDLGLSLMLKGIVCRGPNAVTLSGYGVCIPDNADGVAAQNGAQVTLTLPIESRFMGGSGVSIAAEAGAAIAVEGVLSGTGHFRVPGPGRVDFKAANTFSGELIVSGGEFHAYGDSAFGTAAGKTTFQAATGATWYYYFHGVKTDDAIDWYQTDGNMHAYFEADTVNVFNGPFKGTGGQPRWEIKNNAYVAMSNTVTGVAAFTVQTDNADARFVVAAPLTCEHLRLQSYGKFDIYAPVSFGQAVYCLGFGAITGKVISLYDTNVLRSTHANLGGGPLGIEGGTVDLRGNWQRVSYFLGSSSAVLTSSEGPATLHVLQTLYGNVSTATTSIFNGRYNGRVTGPVTLSIEGNREMVPPDYGGKVYFMPTQMLTAASTATGGLIATNGAVIALIENGAWAGTNIVVHADSKIRLDHSGALARAADVHLKTDGALASGKLVLDEGVLQRCHYLYVDGVRQPRGLYGSLESAADTKNDALFEGKGLFRACGDMGLSINFR